MAETNSNISSSSESEVEESGSDEIEVFVYDENKRPVNLSANKKKSKKQNVKHRGKYEKNCFLNSDLCRAVKNKKRG